MNINENSPTQKQYEHVDLILKEAMKLKIKAFELEKKATEYINQNNMNIVECYEKAVNDLKKEL